MKRAPNDKQPSFPTIEGFGGDKILVDFSHSQKLPVWLSEGDKMVVSTTANSPYGMEKLNKSSLSTTEMARNC